MRGQLTTRNISAALKLARENEAISESGTVTEIAYDRKTHSWTAWQRDEDFKQCGIAGQGRDPLSAVEAMIENNKNNEE